MFGELTVNHSKDKLVAGFKAAHTRPISTEDATAVIDQAIAAACTVRVGSEDAPTANTMSADDLTRRLKGYQGSLHFARQGSTLRTAVTWLIKNAVAAEAGTAPTPPPAPTDAALSLEAAIAAETAKPAPLARRLGIADMDLNHTTLWSLNDAFMATPEGTKAEADYGEGLGGRKLSSTAIGFVIDYLEYPFPGTIKTVQRLEVEAKKKLSDLERVLAPRDNAPIKNARILACCRWIAAQPDLLSVAIKEPARAPTLAAPTPPASRDPWPRLDSSINY